MKILSIDLGINESNIEIKDTENQIVYSKNFNKNDLKILFEDILKYAIKQAKDNNVDEIHIDSHGIGSLAYNYILHNEKELINKIILFRYINL